MKKALIVGISGQDGAYLAQYLLQKGYEVHGTSRDAEIGSFGGLVKLGIRDEVILHSMSLIDFRSVMQTVMTVHPDEIYNLAGQTSVGLSFVQPVEALESITIGTLNILEVIRFHKLKVKFYNAASSECFGDTVDGPANEMTPFCPRSPYAVAKSTAFWLVSNYRNAYDIFACSGILFNHESPLRPQRFVTKKIINSACLNKLGNSNKLKLGNLNISRDWGWAPEYVDAMARIVALEEPKDFVIATGKTTSLESFVEKAFSCLDMDYRAYIEQDDSYRRPLDILCSKADPTRAAVELGWKAVFSVEQIIEKMIDNEMRELRTPH